MALDKRGRIYLGDSGNARVQVFDQNGKLVDIWPNIRNVNSCAMDNNDRFWVGDGNSQRLLQFDQNGHYLYGWGIAGTYPGRFFNINQFSVDTAGNLYTAEVIGGRVQMFRPKKGADPKQLVAKLFQ